MSVEQVSNKVVFTLLTKGLKNNNTQLKSDSIYFSLKDDLTVQQL